MKANFELGLKICSKCKEELPLLHFYKCKSFSDGLEPQCKECKKIYNSSEKGKIVRKRCIKKYRISEKGKNTNKRYESSELGLKAKRRQNNKRYLSGKNATYIRLKRKLNSNFCLKENLRNRIYYALKENRKSTKTMNFLGCSIEDLKQHLESQFIDGMIWDNYGSIWEIDHIIPCSYFDLSVEENQYICFNFRNLQPLFTKDNREKSNKLTENYLEIIDNIKKGIAL